MSANFLAATAGQQHVAQILFFRPVHGGTDHVVRVVRPDGLGQRP